MIQYCLTNVALSLCYLFFSKIFEKLMYSRVLKFINKHKHQFGFREDHSTYMALVTLIDRISPELDNGQFTITVMIDFRKAFDSLKHTLMHNTLALLGFGPDIITLIRSCFTHRYAQILMGGHMSEKISLHQGVPQGDVIAPYIFILMVVIIKILGQGMLT